RPLPEPVAMRAGQPRDYTFGFHHGGDEVTIASWTAAGMGFIAGGLSPASISATYHFGKRALYGLPPGYCAGPNGCGPDSKQLISEMADVSLSAKLRLVLDGDSQIAGCDPCIPAALGRRIQASDGVIWDMENVRAIFDSPTYKSVAGNLQGR